MASNFYKYFKENMDRLNLPAPYSLYGSALVAIGTAKGFMRFVKEFGTKVTVREAIGAGVAGEQLTIIETMAASYYVGAVIGSIGVALQRCAMGGTSMADVLLAVTNKGIRPPYLHSVLIRYPRIIPKPR